MSAEQRYEILCEVLDQLRPDLDAVSAIHQVAADIRGLAAYIEVAAYEGEPPSNAAVLLAQQYDEPSE